MDHLIVKHCPCIRITYKRNIVAEDAARRVHFLKPAVAIASLANQSCKACSGWVFAAVEKVFQWNYPAWSDAISADSDGCGAIEQPLEMIKSIGRSLTQTQTPAIENHDILEESAMKGSMGVGSWVGNPRRSFHKLVRTPGLLSKIVWFSWTIFISTCFGVQKERFS